MDLIQELKEGTLDVKKLEKHATTKGWEPEQILELLSYSLELSNEATAKKIIKLLYPQTKVPETCILKIMGLLGTGIKAPLQSALLKWILLIEDYLESRKTLLQCYGVLFHFISVDQIRPEICHILYSITRKSHVLPYRCRKLISLLDRVGPEPHLIGLLTVYQSYCPEHVRVSLPSARGALFKHPDRIWERTVVKIQEKNKLHVPRQLSIQNRTQQQRRGKKKTSTVVYSKPASDKISIQDISTLEEMIDNMDSLDLPTQLSMIVDRRILLQLICCRPDQSSLARLSHWIHQSLLDLSMRSDQTPEIRKDFSDLLQQTVVFSSLMQEQMPVIESFLVTYLKSWNGLDHQEEIFTLLTKTHPKSYEEIYSCILKPLHHIFQTATVEWRADLIECYRKMLVNWCLIDWKKHYGSLEDKAMVMEEPSSQVDHFKTINEFIKYVDSVCQMSLLIENDHPWIQNAVLTFFETVVNLNTRHNIPFISIPSMPIVFRLMLSDNGMAVSRICGLISKYKVAFSQLKETSHKMDAVVFPGYEEQSFTNGLGNISLFNNYILDLCNMLWRMRNLGEIDQDFFNSHKIGQKLLSQIKENQESPYVFSITHSSAFSTFAKDYYMQKVQEMNLDYRISHVTSDSLKQKELQQNLSVPFMEFRVGYLNYLKERGFKGLSNFLYTFVQSLVKINQSQKA